MAARLVRTATALLPCWRRPLRRRVATQQRPMASVTRVPSRPMAPPPAEAPPDDEDDEGPPCVRVVTFAGQGAQMVGMGRDLLEDYPHVAQVFNDVDEALGLPITQTMFDGPPEALRRPEIAQPALLSYGVACVAILSSTSQQLTISQWAHFLLGHSLGQFTALVAAEALDLADAAKLVHQRGILMRDALAAQPAGQREGAMAAFLYADLAAVVELARLAAAETGQVCQVANVNSPAQVVISGHRHAVEHAMTLGRRGIRVPGLAEPVPLRHARLLEGVGAPFHCSLMQRAATQFAELVEAAPLREANMPILCNVTARPVQSVADIRASLKQHMTSPVQWDASIRYCLAGGANEFVEIGPRRTLNAFLPAILASPPGVAPPMPRSAPPKAKPSDAAKRASVLTALHPTGARTPMPSPVVVSKGVGEAYAADPDDISAKGIAQL